MNKAYLLLGGNEGNRYKWLDKGLTLIEEKCGNISLQSPMYETAAWGLEEQPAFLNMAVCVETTFRPLQLLKQVQEIEAELGRQRTVKWGQRTLDIDILFYNDEVIDLPELKVPHPFLQERRFALVPLNDIAAEKVHPVYKKNIADLLSECPDKLEVKLYQKN